MLTFLNSKMATKWHIQMLYVTDFVRPAVVGSRQPYYHFCYKLDSNKIDGYNSITITVIVVSECTVDNSNGGSKESVLRSRTLSVPNLRRVNHQAMTMRSSTKQIFDRQITIGHIVFGSLNDNVTSSVAICCM